MSFRCCSLSWRSVVAKTFVRAAIRWNHLSISLCDIRQKSLQSLHGWTCRQCLFGWGQIVGVKFLATLSCFGVFDVMSFSMIWSWIKSVNYRWTVSSGVVSKWDRESAMGLLRFVFWHVAMNGAIVEEIHIRIHWTGKNGILGLFLGPRIAVRGHFLVPIPSAMADVFFCGSVIFTASSWTLLQNWEVCFGFVELYYIFDLCASGCIGLILSWTRVYARVQSVLSHLIFFVVFVWGVDLPDRLTTFFG